MDRDNTVHSVGRLDEVVELKPSAHKSSGDANTCIALGVGVGSLGAAAAAVTGALCPLCVIVAPALIGVGGVMKVTDSFRKRKGS